MLEILGDSLGIPWGFSGDSWGFFGSSRDSKRLLKNLADLENGDSRDYMGFC